MKFNKNQLSIPWIESPFFYSLLDESNLSEEEKDLCSKYYENGYVEIDLKLSDKQIDDIVSDMYKFSDLPETVHQSNHYQYTPSKRIFELWKQSESVARLCVNTKILDTLELFYRKKPFPFSTINFFKGSNQPLHSDIIHFHTIPQLWMVGVWVAFEDVNESNGSLRIIPKSHKWGIYDYDSLNLPHPDKIQNGEEVNYGIYEEFIQTMVEEKNAESYIANISKGTALIWSSNLLHGGCNVKGVTDFEKTRLTQAIHYFFDGCEQYYHPMFSKKHEGEYAKKWCDVDNNIDTYLQNGQVNIFDKKVTLK